MAKRKETLEIENRFHYMCQKKRIYGCEEITIGFYHNGHGNEIVDFCTMDSKGILRCYEIKVTLSDLKSKAKKSWHGHYNYLAVSEELYEKISNNLDSFIPSHIGVVIPCYNSWSDGFEVVRKAKKQTLEKEQEMMLKESMIRSMSYKIQKYREACDVREISALKSKLRKAEKDCKAYGNESATLRFVFSRFERILRLYYGLEINIEEIVEKAKIRSMYLPEQIRLNLTQKGKEYNCQVKEYEED